MNNLYIITLLFLIPTVLSMIFRLIGFGYKGKRNLVIGFGIFILYLFMIPPFLTGSLGSSNYLHILVPVMVVGSGTAMIFSSDGAAKTLFLYLVHANLLAVVLSLCNMMRHVLKLNGLFMLLIATSISVLFFWLALRFWAKPLRFMVDEVQTDWETLIEGSIMVLSLVLILPIYPSESFEKHPLYITMIVLGMELCFFLFLFVFYRNLRKIEELSDTAYRQKKWKKCARIVHAELAAREEFLASIQVIRNDLRYHNAQLMEYLENRDIETAVAYIKNYDSQISLPSFPQYCKNRIVNTLLHMYVRLAREENILCKIETTIPEQMPYNDEELCFLFGVLMENAFEYCDKTEKEIFGTLTVSAKTEDSYLKVEISNTAIKKVEFDNRGLPLANWSGGGIGTKIVAEIIAQHGDMVRFLQKNNMFIVQLMIQL